MEPLSRPSMPKDVPWRDVSPLSEHPLAGELDSPGRLAWIDGLVAKYKLSTNAKRPLFHDVKQRIDVRQRESRLFLGVVGEFSSGKSTLINALIRDQLLRADVLQGTTAAATLIHFGPKLAIHVRHRKRNILIHSASQVISGVKTIAGLFRKPRPEPTREELLALLHQATSDEQFAKDVVQVDVQLPTDTLRSGLVIVDTPGANASNPRHAEVTSSALHDLCDAALVVIPAEAAGSESLLAFLNEHAADIAHRCVFIVTKLDLLRRKPDRDRVLDSLRVRLSHQLNLANPRVLAAAPQFVVESLKTQSNVGAVDASASRGEDDAFSLEEIQTWVGHFVEMERNLHTLLLDKRLQAQADDVAKLISDLYDRLKSMIEGLLEEHRKRHEALEKLVIPNIHEFIESRATHYMDRASAGIGKAVRGAGDEFGNICSRIMKDLASAIEGASSRSELKSAIESKVPSILNSGQRRLRGHVESVLYKVSKAGQTELKSFHEEFQTHYRSLATLGGSLSLDQGDLKSATNHFADVTRGVSTEIAAGLQQVTDQRNIQAFGGGAIGAAVGTIVLPGVGTLLGGAIGAIFSSLFGPSLDELKVDCWSRLQPVVIEKLQDVEHVAEDAINDAGPETIRLLGIAIREYGPRYEALVEQMKRRDAAEKTELEAMQRQIQDDLRQIDDQRQTLELLRERIRGL